MTGRLAVIGAGPKAMAIAAKSRVLRELGLESPQIHIVERCRVGANWTGEHGYTNGRLRLGTSPEKDVGFPYRTTDWSERLNREIDRRMLAFSWPAFLVEEGRFSDWVDRGRPAPEHRQWAEYLDWVSRRLGEGTHFHHGEVTKLEAEGSHWRLGYRATDGRELAIEAEGVVITGPGRIRAPSEGAFPTHDGLLTVESFWRIYKQVRQARGARLAIVGAGENAASIAMALADLPTPELSIDILSPWGAVYSRGESFQENRLYSDEASGHWHSLTWEDRRNFIYRTDRGVFSQYAQRVLDQAGNVAVVPGRLLALEPRGARLEARLVYGDSRERREYDFVVMATGADPLAFVEELVGNPGLSLEAAESNIDESLSLRGPGPRLHLPMLSGMTQGPGFSNLSCLGRLSDRVLRPYLGDRNAH